MLDYVKFLKHKYFALCYSFKLLSYTHTTYTALNTHDILFTNIYSKIIFIKKFRTEAEYFKGIFNRRI